ncbi:hypothetical protein PENTCL1PPCAC_29173, partial [Pristionchus entomophagus]
MERASSSLHSVHHIPHHHYLNCESLRQPLQMGRHREQIAVIVDVDSLIVRVVGYHVGVSVQIEPVVVGRVVDSTVEIERGRDMRALIEGRVHQVQYAADDESV